MQTVKVGIVQCAPVYADLEASLARLEEKLTEAARQGAQIVVFGETWLTGYPAWLDHSPSMAFWDHQPTKQVFARLWEQSPEVPGPVTERLGQLAKEQGVILVLGVNERVATGSLYNGLLIFDEHGQLIVHHRKLMPTYTEKLLYHFGDAEGLKVAETSAGKIGGLICWEHWMPMARQVLHDGGEQIHFALWPTVHEMHQVAIRQYAFEGRCYVIGVGQMMRAADFPEALDRPEALRQHPETLICRGGSAIVGPDGQYVLAPQFEQEGVFVAELDLRRVYEEKLSLDTAGHYFRPDVFRYEVNRQRPR